MTFNNRPRLRGNSGLINTDVIRESSNSRGVTQTGTNELMMTERGQEGPYKGTRHGDTGLTLVVQWYTYS